MRPTVWRSLQQPRGGPEISQFIVTSDQGGPIASSPNREEAERAAEFLGPEWSVVEVGPIVGHLTMIWAKHDKKYPLNTFSVSYHETKSVTGEESRYEGRDFRYAWAANKDRALEMLKEMACSS